LEEKGAEVGPAGGQFEIDGIKVVVPEGALDKTTFLTLKKVRPSDNAEMEVELGPSDVKFSKPVEISYQAAEGTDLSQMKLASWGGRGWRPLRYRDPYGINIIRAEVFGGCRIGLTRDYDCRANVCRIDRDCFAGEVCDGYGGCVPAYSFGGGGFDCVDHDCACDGDDCHPCDYFDVCHEGGRYWCTDGDPSCDRDYYCDGDYCGDDLYCRVDDDCDFGGSCFSGSCRDYRRNDFYDDCYGDDCFDVCRVDRRGWGWGWGRWALPNKP
jgi:hypothetical protein